MHVYNQGRDSLDTFTSLLIFCYLGDTSPVSCGSASGSIFLPPFTFEAFLSEAPELCTCEDESEVIPELPDIEALSAEAAQAAMEITPEAVQQAVFKFMSDLQTSCPGLYITSRLGVVHGL